MKSLLLVVLGFHLVIRSFPQLFVDTSMPSQTGSVTHFNDTVNFFSILDTVQPGDTIVLSSNATLISPSGGFLLFWKMNPNNPRIIITTNETIPENIRVTPSQSKLFSNDNLGS